MTRNKSTTLSYKDLISSNLREKYPFFLLGAAVIVVFLSITAGRLFKNKSLFPNIAQKNTAPDKTNTVKSKTYTVKQGDHLWKIAENTYGSGYNAYDIAAANKLTNASLVYAGQKLVLPSVQPKTPTIGEIAMGSTDKVTFAGTTYKVKSGDYLWKIAVEAYGDGYAWTRIAQANRLANPDIIHANNNLKIPR